MTKKWLIGERFLPHCLLYCSLRLVYFSAISRIIVIALAQFGRISLRHVGLAKYPLADHLERVVAVDSAGRQVYGGDREIQGRD